MYMGKDSVFGKVEAKKKIVDAIFGLLLALGAYALLNTINPDLLGGKGVNIATQTVKLSATSGGGYFGVDLVGNPNVVTTGTNYNAFFKAAADKYGVDCTMAKAFMYAESSGVNEKQVRMGHKV